MKLTASGREWREIRGGGGLVGRRELSGLLNRHFGLAAQDSAYTGLSAQHHRAATLALVSSS